MKTTSLFLSFSLLALPLSAQDTSSTDEAAAREKLSSRLLEAHKASPDRLMMAPKTGEKPISELQPVTTPVTAPDSSEKGKSEVVDLPAMKVQGNKETVTTWEAKRQVVELEKQIEKEKARTQATEADVALNPDKGSIMGNLNAKGRTEDAKRRVHELEVKQSIAAVATDPNNEEENKKLLKMLQDLEYQKRQH